MNATPCMDMKYTTRIYALNCSIKND